MAASSRGEPLRFRGSPGSLAATIRDAEAPAARRCAVRVETEADEAWATQTGTTHTAHSARFDGSVILQLALPRRTPPGRYRGTIEVDGEERAAEFDVEPEIELRIVPDQLSLHGVPGDHVGVSLSFANDGNVALDIRPAYAFGIFAQGGIERALHRAYVDDRAEGESRLEYLLDRLADEHGGLVRVAIEDGAGELEPGDTREVSVNFHIPAELKPNRTYTGILSIHDVGYPVELHVANGKERSHDVQ